VSRFNPRRSLRIQAVTRSLPRIAMKRLPLACAALLILTGASFAGTASAGGRIDACEFESDFDLRIAADALTFHRESGTPANVVMRDGSLSIDGRDVALSGADRARVQKIEREVRALVPEVKAIALDAVGIASDAIIQVSAALTGTPDEATARRARELVAKLRARIEASDDSRDWNEGEFEQAVSEFTAELTPSLVGNVAALAVQAALSGDESGAKALEQRIQNFEKELEARVEARAKEIETRADALCLRLAELDALESALELRLADQRPLDLMQLQR
jgi:hypothetical protein